jgi:hypothetical protein
MSAAKAHSIDYSTRGRVAMHRVTTDPAKTSIQDLGTPRLVDRAPMTLVVNRRNRPLREPAGRQQ